MQQKKEIQDSIDKYVRNGRYKPNDKNQWFSNFQAARQERASKINAESSSNAKQGVKNAGKADTTKNLLTGNTGRNSAHNPSVEPSAVIRKRLRGSLRNDAAYFTYDPKQSVVRVKSDESSLILFNMNNLPGITQLRIVLIILCVLCFLAAPFVYVPLGTIQAQHGQKCFLFATLYYDRKTALAGKNDTYKYMYEFVPQKTNWGQGHLCDFTTYTAVSTAIFSLIMGWLTIQLWPDIMTDGGGGALAVFYATMSILCLAANFTSSRYIMDGFNQTCSKIVVSNGQEYRSAPDTERQGIKCHNLNNTLYPMDENEETKGLISLIGGLEKLIILTHRIHLVMIASWAITGLALFKILLSAYAYFIIWYYCYYDPHPVYEIPVMAAMSLSTIKESVDSFDLKYITDPI